MSRIIPSTHTGSLPRSDDLIQIMWAVGDGIPVDKNALDERVSSAIKELVGKQVAAGATVRCAIFPNPLIPTLVPCHQTP